MIFGVIVFLVACNDKNNALAGTEGKNCYGNGTCNAGLACLSDICIVPKEEPSVKINKEKEFIKLDKTGEWEVREDVVIDKNSTLMWQRGHSEDLSMSQYDAIEYCQDLILDGHEDWRLPSISELRTVIQGCKRTEPGGACKVEDKCQENCWEGLCSCKAFRGTGEKGFYWTKGVWKNKTEFGSFWSSSIFNMSMMEMPSDKGNGAWYVKFYDGGVGGFFRSGNGGNYSARCVRIKK